jgi:hypothetical protein
MVLYLHSLNGYLRYWQFPEKMYNNIAFRKHSSFLLLFTRHMISDIADQYRFLRAVSTSRKERLILNFLYAMHHIFYNLGRGTFSGTLSKTVEHYLADNPGCLLTPDPRG